MEFPQSQYCLTDIDMNGPCIAHEGNVLSTIFTLGGYDLGQDKFGYRRRKSIEIPSDLMNKIKVIKVGYAINRTIWAWN